MAAKQLLPLACAVYLAANTWVFFFSPVLGSFFLAVMIACAVFRPALRKPVCVSLIVVALFAVRWIWWQSQAEYVRSLEGETNSFHAIVLKQELTNSQKQRLIVKTLMTNNDRLKGQKIQMVLPRFPSYDVGQTIDFSCTFSLPEDDDVPYKSILAARSMYLLCDQSELNVVETKPSWLRHPLLAIRVTMLTQIARLWPRPNASLVRGLLLGDRADFEKGILENFSKAGISHIIALSGFNISVIFLGLEVVLLRARLRKSARVVLMILIMAAFVVLVGAASSIVRAAAMGGLAIVGRLCGRRPQAARLLLISAAAMCFMNPYVLLYDAGFQLSCLATAGLLTLSDRFAHWCRFMPEKFSLRGSLSTTLAASAPTLPLLMHQFDAYSIIAPVSNMAILPLIPWLMGLSALTVLLEAFPLINLLAPIFAWLTAAGCTYILRASAFFAGLPFASTPVAMPSWLFVVLLILVSCWMYYESKPKKVTA